MVLSVGCCKRPGTEAHGQLEPDSSQMHDARSVRRGGFGPAAAGGRMGDGQANGGQVGGGGASTVGEGRCDLH